MVPYWMYRVVEMRVPPLPLVRSNASSPNMHRDELKYSRGVKKTPRTSRGILRVGVEDITFINSEIIRSCYKENGCQYTTVVEKRQTIYHCHRIE